MREAQHDASVAFPRAARATDREGQRKIEMDARLGALRTAFGVRLSGGSSFYWPIGSMPALRSFVSNDAPSSRNGGAERDDNRGRQGRQ